MNFAVCAILSPPDTFRLGLEPAPLVVIRAADENEDDSASVRLSIDSTSYDETFDIYIEPGETDTIDEFSAWEPDSAGTFLVHCALLIADDTAANDTLSKQVQVLPPWLDCKVASIEEPEDSVDYGDSLTPSAIIIASDSNSVDLDSIVVQFRIDTLYCQTAVEYAVSPGDTVTVDFAKEWGARPLRSHTVVCSLLTSDSVPDNDVLRETTFVQFASGWTEAADLEEEDEKTVYNGGWVCCTPVETLMFAVKGNGSAEFSAYNPEDDNWVMKKPIPYGDEHRYPKKGAVGVCDDSGHYIYATKGNNSQGFWRYSIPRDTWEPLAVVPIGPSGKKVKGGTDAVYVAKNGVGYVYLLKGYKNEFYKYAVSSGQWSPPDIAPIGSSRSVKYANGSWLAYDGDNTIYCHKAKYNELFAYDVTGDSWHDAQLTGMPLYGRTGKKKKSKDGGCGAWLDGSIYALKGGNTQEFWEYVADRDSWYELDTLPVGDDNRKVKGGGDIATYQDGMLYALKGNKTMEFWCYVPGAAGISPGQDNSPPPGKNELCLAEDGDAEDVRWSNGGDWVACTAIDQDGHRQVFKVSSDSGAPVQLTSLNGECSRPVWSPGDTSIAFEVTPDSTGYSQIAVTPGDSGAVTYLTTSSYDHWHATWSPSGLVGYLRDDATGYPQVYVKLATGETPMTQASVEHESPEFASATVVTFAREGLNGYTQVYTTTVGSQSETPITSSSADHANPVPVPDGAKVFYEVDDAYGYTQVAKVKLQGGPELVLTSGSYDFESPTVNGNGGLIFCTKSDGPGSSICQVNSSGGYTELTDDDVERVVPHAQPNGTTSISAAYVRDGDVFRLTAGGDGQQTALLFPFALEGAKPNPGRARIVIRWQLPAEARASLRIYNSAGQLVKVLSDGMTKPGAHTSVWNGTDARCRRLANGVYFCALDNGSKRISRKLVLTD